MENASKRLKYTFQNIGLAVEALPQEMRCAHGTLKNDKAVEAFVNFIVDTMTGDLEKQRQKAEIQRLKEEVNRLSKALDAQMVNIMKVEDLKVQLAKSMAAAERYKDLFNQANNRLHQINDYTLDTYESKPIEAKLIELDDGSVVDTSTGEIKPSPYIS